MRLFFFKFVVLLLAGGVAEPAWADHSMVLITSARTNLESITALDLRKVYLGFSVSADSGGPITPLYNASEARLEEIFLQDVMGMSARSYDRRLLALALQSGRRRPERLTAVDELLEQLQRRERSIAFAWEEDVRNRDDIKVLRVLWHR